LSREAWQKDRAVLRQYFDDALPEDITEAQYWATYHRGEEAAVPRENALFERCLAIKRGGSFLEIGIGYNPNPVRIKDMLANGVRYTGLDLSVVCDRHRSVLETATRYGLSYRLIGNRAGSYLYNIVDLARAGETFDLIYFDGHHTMYVDAGPLVIAAGLLAPDGIFVVDDIDWSLSMRARDMYVSHEQWNFYRSHYDFDQYEPAQIRECPMQALVDVVLIGQLGFALDPELTCMRKAVLCRPTTR
jgi:predicted O-methyltransferase YrrM